MKTPKILSLLILLLVPTTIGMSLIAQLPVNATHPRLLMNATIKDVLLNKKNNSDADWLEVKALADELATKPILDFNQNTISTWDDSKIFYTYEGGGWYDAAMPLAFAHLLTKGNNTGSFPTIYSDKLIDLAEEMISAQYDPLNTCADCLVPLEVDSYFPTRFIGMTISIIFDYCYEELSPSLKSQMVTLMNDYFDSMRNNAYQINERASGNYFFGHVICAAAMGYASAGDNLRSDELIAFARMRFDGSPSALVDPANIPQDNVVQTFEGGYRPVANTFTSGAIAYTGNPNKGGLPIQGWAYGVGTMSRIMEYMMMVHTATGEDLFLTYPDWMPNLLLAMKHSLLPNRYEIDHIGDWGGNVVGIAPLNLPHRLAYILADTEWAAQAQYFATEDIIINPNWGSGLELSSWEKLYYDDATRPATPFVNLDLYYSGFDHNAYNPINGNGALCYTLMRNNWEEEATWASFKAGASIWDDHQHNAGGSLEIKQGDAYLLIDANQFGAGDQNGIAGGNNQGYNSGQANTLFFSDYGDVYDLLLDGNGNMSSTYIGGQTSWGWDDVKAIEMNNVLTYIRTDLTYAYTMPENYVSYNDRPLNYMYRNFIYLRDANIFVVYDQAAAKPSNHPNGPYDIAQRWHLTANPIPSGDNKIFTTEYGNSKLYTHLILPTNPVTQVAFQNPNPDADEYSMNSDTWRLEVRNTSHPTIKEFITLFAPGTATMPDVNTTAINSSTGSMKGLQCTLANGQSEILLFNTDTNAVQVPINEVSYSFTPFMNTGFHTLCGMIPNAHYDVTILNNTISINASPTGAFTASPQGLLRVCNLNPTIGGSITSCAGASNAYYVPAISGSVYNWSVAGGTIISGQGTNQIEVIWDNGSSTGTVQLTQLIP